MLRRLALIFSLIPFVAQAAPVRIDFHTDWKAQAEHGGFYQAVAKGYYARRGLDVRIRQGGSQTDLPRLMAAGAIDVGMASNSFQPLNMVRAGAKAKVVMAAFQKDPQVFMTHPSVKVKSPAELKGRPVILSDSAVTTIWPWARARFGFSDRQIRKYTYSLVPWIRTPNAVQEGYITSEPYTAQKAGIRANLYPLADYGYPGYAGMVMMSERFMKANPAAAKAFVAASIEGWNDYLKGNPAPGNRLILKDNREMTPELIAFGIATMKQHGLVTSGDGTGRMSAARWQTFHKDMSALGPFPKNLDWKSAFTLEYLP